MFAQFLKDSKHPKYTIAQINNYPTTTYAVQVVTTLSYAWASDSFLKGDRLPPIIFGAVRSYESVLDCDSTSAQDEALVADHYSSSISSATPHLQFGRYRMVGDGPAIFSLEAATVCLDSAWRK